MSGTFTSNLDFYGMMDRYKYHNKLSNINSGLYGTGDHLGMVQRFELPRDPTANDDDKNNANAGKRVLLPAMWLNISTQKTFICLDNTSASAVWFQVASQADIDALVDATMKNPEAYDPTITGNYPTTYGGEAIEEGDTFRITAVQAGIGDGTRDVMGQDLLIAITDAPSATAAGDWMVAEGNLDQATESIMGIAKIATQVIADAGTNDTNFVTPLKLATYLTNAGIHELTFVNGITEDGSGNVSLGGTFTANTDLYRDGNAFEIKDGSTANEQLYIDDTDVKLLVGGTDTVAGFTGNWNLGATETTVKMATASYSLTLTSGGASDTAVFADTNAKGLVYGADYSANFTARSLIDKGYVDTLVDATLKAPEAYDPTTTGNYPTTYDGEAIEKGDSFRITADQAGIGDGTRDVNTEDLLIAITDAPSATVSTDWMVAESNRDQATESVMGVAKIASQAIADTGTSNTDIITPLRLTGYLVNAGYRIVDFSNGITYSAGIAKLGGDLVENTDLYRDGFAFEIKNGSTDNEQLFIDDTDVKLLVGGTDAAAGFTANWNSAATESTVVMGTSSYSLTLTSGGASDTAVFADTNSKGLVYGADYSANFTARSLIDQAYVLSVIDGWNKESITLTATDISNGYFDLAQTPLDNSLDLIVSGVVKAEGAAKQYTISGNRVTIVSGFADGDVVEAKYFYNV